MTSMYFRNKQCQNGIVTTFVRYRIPTDIGNIGVGRFRILGGQGLEYWRGGGQGRPNSPQAHDVVTTSMRPNDVASTSLRRHVPTRFLTNQCQIHFST